MPVGSPLGRSAPGGFLRAWLRLRLGTPVVPSLALPPLTAAATARGQALLSLGSAFASLPPPSLSLGQGPRAGTDGSTVTTAPHTPGRLQCNLSLCLPRA